MTNPNIGLDVLHDMAEMERRVSVKRAVVTNSLRVIIEFPSMNWTKTVF